MLDPFIGSGTTAIVAVRMNRHYIGFDIADKYINLAQGRIRNEKGNGTQRSFPL